MLLQYNCSVVGDLYSSKARILCMLGFVLFILLAKNCLQNGHTTQLGHQYEAQGTARIDAG